MIKPQLVRVLAGVGTLRDAALSRSVVVVWDNLSVGITSSLVHQLQDERSESLAHAQETLAEHVHATLLSL
jgi:hypothetical protein